MVYEYLSLFVFYSRLEVKSIFMLCAGLPLFFSFFSFAPPPPASFLSRVYICMFSVHGHGQPSRAGSLLLSGVGDGVGGRCVLIFMYLFIYFYCAIV
jgi:hypothetical protein